MKKLIVVVLVLLTSIVAVPKINALSTKTFIKEYDWGNVEIEATLLNDNQQLEMITKVVSKPTKTFERANIVILYDTNGRMRFDTKCIPSEFESNPSERYEKYGRSYVSCFNQKYTYDKQLDNLKNAFARLDKLDSLNRLKFGFNQFALGTVKFLDGPIADSMNFLDVDYTFNRTKSNLMKNRDSGAPNSEIVEVVNDFRKNPNGKNIIYIISNFWQFQRGSIGIYHGDHIADIKKFENDIDMVIPIDVSGVETREEHYYKQIDGSYFFFDIYSETKARELAYNAEIIDGIEEDDIGKFLENHITKLLLKNDQPMISDFKMTIVNGDINLLSGNSGKNVDNQWVVSQYQSQPQLSIRHLLNRNSANDFGEIDLEVNGTQYKIYINDILNSGDTNKAEIPASNSGFNNVGVVNDSENNRNSVETTPKKPDNLSENREDKQNSFIPNVRKLEVYQNSNVSLAKAVTNLEPGMIVKPLADYKYDLVGDIKVRAGIYKNDALISETDIPIKVEPVNLKKIVSYKHFNINWDNILETKLPNTKIKLVNDIDLDTSGDKNVELLISNPDSEVKKELRIKILDLLIKPPHLYSFMTLKTDEVFLNLDSSHSVEWLDKYEYSNFDQKILRAKLITNTNEHIIEVPIYRLSLNLSEIPIINQEIPNLNNSNLTKDDRIKFKIIADQPKDANKGIYEVEVYYDNKLVDTIEVPYSKIQMDLDQIDNVEDIKRLCPNCIIDNNILITPSGNKFPLKTKKDKSSENSNDNDLLKSLSKNQKPEVLPKSSSTNKQHLDNNYSKSKDVAAAVNEDNALNRVNKEASSKLSANVENNNKDKDIVSKQEASQPIVATPASDNKNKLNIPEIAVDKNGIVNLEDLKQKYPGYDFKLLEMIDTSNPHKGRTRLMIKHPDNSTTTQWIDYVVGDSDSTTSQPLPSTGTQLIIATVIGIGLVIVGVTILIFVKKKDSDNPYNY